MARLHGRRGRIYLGIASDTSTAESLTFMTSWSLDAESDKEDVTAFGDGNKVYVAGLPDAKGEFNGFLDDATSQHYTAASDGLARKFYLYPDNSSTGKYWFGTVLVDFKAEGEVAGAVKVSGSWAAASVITRIGV